MVTQPTFFDEPEPEPELPRSTWNEVPQALFLSWPRTQQLAYCAARDEDSALYCDGLDLAYWYQARAKGYREDLCQEVSTNG